MEHLRSYEISIWTLQDSFITVLKPSNLDFREQIIDPIMSIKDDGDNKLSFKIPMYILNDSGEFEENPFWYNTINGIIVANLRKAKVIFNKNTSEEEVFEFIIINVKERHDGYKKYCEVECEGLAFHELGKQGYKIALEGYNEIEIKQKEYFEAKEDSENEEISEKTYPQPTINYWIERVFEGTNWDYSIQMDWSMHDGITHQVYETPAAGVLDSDNYSSFTKVQRDNFNIKRELDGLRRRDRVYEDEYVSTWKEENDKLIPAAITKEKEKYRPVNAKESNRYNLTQTIAETFQVYCKYKYYYDDNYHIIGREAIFYNNFLNESQGAIDLTYKYNTEHLTRIMDSTDTINKMYVRPLVDGDVPTGETTISDAESNKSLEDYILNFDYMLGIGTITQEQYDEIEPYYLKLRKLNQELIEITNELIVKENEKIKQEARKKNAEDALIVDQEAVDNNNALARSIGNENGEVEIDANNPQSLYLIKEEGKNSYFCNFRTQGIIGKSVKLYTKYNNLEPDISNRLKEANRIKKYTLINDESGNLIKAINISANTENLIYAIYRYNPEIYYNNIIKTFQNRVAQDKAIIEDADKILGDEKDTSKVGLYQEIKTLESNKKEKIKEKQEIINSFERMMGPALREGQWQPEDEYAGYGEVHEEKITYGQTKGLLTLKWDNELFDDEQKNYFNFGAELKKYYYPCIEITNSMINTFGIENFLKELTFIYKNTELGSEQSSKQYMGINSKMVFGFIRELNADGTSSNKRPSPVLILLDAEHMDTDQLSLLEQGYLGTVSTNSQGEIIEANTYSNLNWIIKPTQMDRTSNTLVSYETVFPRFIINSLRVKSPETTIGIKRGEVLLKNYEDYYILPRINNYTITLKPHIFLQTKVNFTTKFNFYYTISTAALAVYLDAIQILKENSYPKVSYEIDVMSVNKDFIYNAYSHLGQIAHINDYEFKFDNTLGYISELSLDLDRPWQDKVVIKNYKTKFEDLFSTIVAQSEQMKKNSAIIGLAAGAFNSNGTLKGSTIGNSVINVISSKTETTNLVSAPATEYTKYEEFIRSQLRQSWQEAGEVLAAAQSSVSDVAALNIKNADILATFKTNIGENLTPTLFKLGEVDGKNYSTRTKINPVNKKEIPIDSFKVGDVLIYGESTYMATENSSQVNYDEGEIRGTSLKGWSRTTDGRLAAITGASLNVDAAEGAIEIKAQHTLSLLCNGLIDISGNDVSISGNRTVQIGGPDIKIYSAYKNEPADTTKGIHIYSTVYGATNSTSAVEITGEGVTIGSAGKIDIEADKGINIFSSNNKKTSAVRISRKEGIYLGSNLPIVLYAGEVGAKPENSYPTGASVEISQKRILFGVSDGDQGTAVKMTKKYLVFGAGNVVNDTNDDDEPNIGDDNNNAAAGVKITKNAIKMAVGSGNTRSYFKLTGDQITIAQNNHSENGSIIQMGKSGVIIGTATDKIIGKDGILNSNGYNGARFQVYAPNFVVDANGKMYANEAAISGDITATAFTLVDGVQIPMSDIKDLETEFGRVKAVEGKVTYQRSNNGVNTPQGDWLPSIEEFNGSNGRYLWTRTIITYADGKTQSTSYSVSYEGKNGENGEDGEDGKYVTKVISLYYLKTNNNDVPNPSTPEISNKNKENVWTTVVPTYPKDEDKEGTYYRCEKQTWNDGLETFSNVYEDGGLTIANKNATSASIAARDAAAGVEKFNTNGLELWKKWNNKYYNVALTSKTNLLIGANSGITIVKPKGDDSEGSAMVLDKSGIALYGASIMLQAEEDEQSSVVSLNKNGIDLGSSGTLTINTDNFKVQPSATKTNPIFYVGDKDNTKYLKYSAKNGLEVKGAITATSLKITVQNESGGIEDKDFDTILDDKIEIVEDLASGKAKVFTGTTKPKPPFHIGDIWVQGNGGEIKYCQKKKLTGDNTYTESEYWTLASKYTSNSDNAYTGSTPKLAINDAITNGTLPSGYTAKPGDIFIADGTNTGTYKYAGRAYRYTGSSWVAISSGAIEGTKLLVDTEKGDIKINATSNMEIISGQTLDLATNGKLSITGAGGVEIGSGGILTITSNGKLSVDSPNFKVNPDATGTTSIFYVGKSGNYLKYSKDNGLEVKGQIDATSGSIGTWTIGSNYIGSGTTRAASQVGMSYVTGTSDTAAFWAGADGSSVNSAKFLVTKGGVLTAIGATISGTITATSGSIGTWTIGSNFLGSGDTALTSAIGMLNITTGTGASTVFWAGHDVTKTALTDSPFRVTRDGTLHASGAIISGKITATSGEIGGCSISGGKLIIPAANISGTLTIGQLPESDITTITENTIKTTTVVAKNLQVNAANVSGTLTGKTISGGTISGTEISGASIKLGDLSSGGTGSISMYTDLGLKIIGIWDKTSLRLYNKDSNDIYLSIKNNSISQIGDFLTINSPVGIKITQLSTTGGGITIQARNTISILSSYTNAAGTTTLTNVEITGKNVYLNGDIWVRNKNGEYQKISGQ